MLRASATVFAFSLSACPWRVLLLVALSVQTPAVLAVQVPSSSQVDLSRTAASIQHQTHHSARTTRSAGGEKREGVHRRTHTAVAFGPPGEILYNLTSLRQKQADRHVLNSSYQVLAARFNASSAGAGAMQPGRAVQPPGREARSGRELSRRRGGQLAGNSRHEIEKSKVQVVDPFSGRSKLARGNVLVQNDTDDDEESHSNETQSKHKHFSLSDPLAIVPGWMWTLLLLSPCLCCSCYCVFYAMWVKISRPWSLKKLGPQLALLEEFAQKVRGQICKEPVIFHQAVGLGRTFETLAKGAHGSIVAAESRYTAAVSGKPKTPEDLSPEEVATNWRKHGFLGWWKTVMDCKQWMDSGSPAPIDHLQLVELTNVVRHDANINVTHVCKRTKQSKEFVFSFPSTKEANIWAENLELMLLKLKVLQSISGK